MFLINELSFRMLWKSGCSLILLLTTIASLDAMMEDFVEDETTISSASTNSSTVSFTTMPSSERTTVNSSNIVKNPDEETIQDSSHASSPSSDTVWECPNITKAGVECSCDFPHTLRCTGDRTALQVIINNPKRVLF